MNALLYDIDKPNIQAGCVYERKRAAKLPKEKGTEIGSDAGPRPNEGKG